MDSALLFVPRMADGRVGDTVLEVTYAPDLCVELSRHARPIDDPRYTTCTAAGDCAESQMVEARELAALADHPDVQGHALNRAAWAYLQALPPETTIGLCWLWPCCWWLPWITHRHLTSCTAPSDVVGGGAPPHTARGTSPAPQPRTYWVVASTAGA
jgi:hypothetical protein